MRVAPGSARASCSLCSLCRVAGLSTYQKLARSRGCALTASCHVSVGEQRLRPLLRQLDPTIPTLEPRHKFPAPSPLQPPKKPSKVESPRLIIHRLVRGCHGSSFRASLWPTLPGTAGGYVRRMIQQPPHTDEHDATHTRTMTPGLTLTLAKIPRSCPIRCTPMAASRLR